MWKAVTHCARLLSHRLLVGTLPLSYSGDMWNFHQERSVLQSALNNRVSMLESQLLGNHNFILSGWLNVDKDVERTNQIVRTKRTKRIRHLIGSKGNSGNIDLSRPQSPFLQWYSIKSPKPWRWPLFQPMPLLRDFKLLYSEPAALLVGQSPIQPYNIQQIPPSHV